MDSLYLENLVPKLSEEAAKALYSVAYNSYQSGNYADAAAFFRLLTQQSTDHRAAWMGLGASLQMLKNYAEAIAAYGCAAVLNENDPYVHLHAAECFHALKDSAKALQALDAALACESKPELQEQLTLLRTLWTQGGNNG